MAAYTTVDSAGSFFNTILWTGTSTTPQALTGVGFQPDFVWVKKRSSAAAHCVTDVVRGVTETLFPNDVTAETTRTGGLTAFGADGFTVGADGDFNGNGATFAGWNWKAGTTTGIDTTGATITPDGYSFNATSGFSIIKYTGNGVSGALVPHGLGVVPGMIIVKSLSSDEWIVYTSTSGATKYQALNTTMATSTSTSAWNDTEPTSTLFSLGNGGDVNTDTEVYMAYCFAPVQGFSKFGGYTGNGDNDGTFVYTGFRPAFIMTKRTDSTSDWVMYDNKRAGYNGQNNFIYADTTAGADTSNAISSYFLSNGWKAYNTVSQVSTGTYIYMAFAENPFVNSSGVPGNAR